MAWATKFEPSRFYVMNKIAKFVHRQKLNASSFHATESCTTKISIVEVVGARFVLIIQCMDCTCVFASSCSLYFRVYLQVLPFVHKK